MVQISVDRDLDRMVKKKQRDERRSVVEFFYDNVFSLSQSPSLNQIIVPSIDLTVHSVHSQPLT